MRIIEVVQRSEEWERWRNRPTASEFGSFITPARGDYSAQASKYAAKIVCKQRGTYVEKPPTFAMAWGTEQEPNAKLAYTKQTGHEITEAGFIIPDGTDSYGGSPDGLVGDDGLIEIKCPEDVTLAMYHADGEFPVQYKPQVQGLLLISGRAWCDFYVFHPQLTPFLMRILPDEEYQAKIAEGLLQLLEDIERLKSKVKRVNHEIVSISQDNLRFNDE